MSWMRFKAEFGMRGRGGGGAEEGEKEKDAVVRMDVRIIWMSL